MMLQWLGNASFKIKTFDNKVIYIDPYSGEDYEDKADLILISHGHYDHCSRDKIKRVRIDSTQILAGEKGLASEFNCSLVSEGDVKDFGWVRIKAVASYNIGKNFHPKGEALGFLIDLEGKIIYFAGDTDLIPEMKELGRVDVALLPIGGTYTMNADEAAKAVEEIKPKLVIPMHFGKVAGTLDDAELLKELVEPTGVIVKVLKEEESCGV